MTATVNASTSAGVIVTSDTSGALALQTAGTTALTISSAQAITMAGRTTNPTTISVGNATPSTSGSGISFPSSQDTSSDANTLDDYEEGTWTPTITLNSGTATTYTSPTGTYTKTGRMVTVLGSIFPTNGTIGSTNGYMRITGLPFTVGLVNGIGSGMNTSNYNNGISVTTTYSTTLDAGFVTGCAQSNTYGFVATYFV